ncbi:unnamed protein product [Cladocopium goreaui]|uniref:Pentatricopeptide repeat-containing protein, mitochondrial n=1 Tax=Cladocopium goreaui TaxID=2562237 RepID=A0A9P1FNF8_9DINO|nr:unnamed protein product [Cladocopium goreaui]
MLARSCYMNAGFNPVDANRMLQCFANGLYHQVGNLSEQLPGLNLKHLGCSRVGAYRLAEMAFLTSAEKTLGWLVTPPFMCHQCCQQGHGRLMVLLARNPYMRVASYFKRWMITKFGGWPNFATFVTVLMEVTNTTNCFRDCIGAEFPWLNSDDVLHLRSVKEMLDDPRIQPPRSARQFSVLRLENWKEDWKAIEDRLCSEFHHCEHLPPPPRAKGDHHAHTERLTRDVISWAKLWQDLKKPMLFRYGWDFYHLGYSTDPTKLRPLRPAQPSRST